MVTEHFMYHSQRYRPSLISAKELVPNVPPVRRIFTTIQKQVRPHTHSFEENLMFESLWIDKPNAEERINEIRAEPQTSKLGDYLAHYHKEGFVIIPQAVNP